MSDWHTFSTWRIIQIMPCTSPYTVQYDVDGGIREEPVAAWALARETTHATNTKTGAKRKSTDDPSIEALVLDVDHPGLVIAREVSNVRAVRAGPPSESLRWEK